MLWCQSTQNIGLSNCELKSGITSLNVHRTITMHARPRDTDRRSVGQTDGQTDELHGSSVTIRSTIRFKRTHRALQRLKL